MSLAGFSGDLVVAQNRGPSPHGDAEEQHAGGMGRRSTLPWGGLVVPSISHPTRDPPGEDAEIRRFGEWEPICAWCPHQWGEPPASWEGSPAPGCRGGVPEPRRWEESGL